MAVVLEDVQADNTIAVSSISMQSVILLLSWLVPSIRNHIILSITPAL